MLLTFLLLFILAAFENENACSLWKTVEQNLFQKLTIDIINISNTLHYFDTYTVYIQKSN